MGGVPCLPGRHLSYVSDCGATPGEVRAIVPAANSSGNSVEAFEVSLATAIDQAIGACYR